MARGSDCFILSAMSRMNPVFAQAAAVMLVDLFAVFAQPAERALRAAEHAVEFVPADFRRLSEIAEYFSLRVIATVAAPQNDEGRVSRSLHAGATVNEIHAASRDPKRLLLGRTRAPVRAFASN